MGEKILLVDDDPDITSLLQDELTAQGYAVKICDGGEEVLAAMHSYLPDLLIMDVMLPGIDGYSLTNHIGEDPDLCKIPLIIMSALTTSRAMFETKPQVAAFFSKPFSNEEFMEAVKTALTKQD
ncbi:MAG TPA: hypothetical protein DCZ92_02455 [Elusimicrobia bacterium]|nr:MAG: hypothetical protein A2016_00305 [Elusimicrobia bacterium GWF2_62_30]HBA59686.1 hypothetical protein [Elusimicrobiota bacterium]